MFVSLPSRRKPALRWATPALFATLWGVFLWAATRPVAAHGTLLLDWGALAGGLSTPQDWVADRMTWSRSCRRWPSEGSESVLSGRSVGSR
jgi:hypothetical protein